MAKLENDELPMFDEEKIQELDTLIKERIEETDRLRGRVEEMEAKEKQSEFEILELRNRVDRLSSQSRDWEKTVEFLELSRVSAARNLAESVRECLSLRSANAAIENEKAALTARVGSLEEEIGTTMAAIGLEGIGFNPLMVIEEQWERIARLTRENEWFRQAMDSVKGELEGKNEVIEKLCFEKAKLDSEIQPMLDMVMRLANGRVQLKKGGRSSLKGRVSEMEMKVELLSQGLVALKKWGEAKVSFIIAMVVLLAVAVFLVNFSLLGFSFGAR